MLLRVSHKSHITASCMQTECTISWARTQSR